MLTLVMLVALAQVDGGTPADAPLRNGAHLCGTVEHKPDGGVDQAAPGCARIVNVGDPAPYAGVLNDEQEDVHRTSREKAKTVELSELKTGNFIMPVAGYLGITGGAVAFALAVLSAILGATGHLK